MGAAHLSALNADSYQKQQEIILAQRDSLENASQSRCKRPPFIMADKIENHVQISETDKKPGRVDHLVVHMVFKQSLWACGVSRTYGV